MSNVNTVAGFYNVPAQLAAIANAGGSSTGANVFQVPAGGAYPGLPSPTLPVASGLSVSLSPDIAVGATDVHPFKIRVCGKATTTGAASTIIPILYQVNGVAVGVIAAAGGITSTGVVGTGATLLHTCATIASSNVATVEFMYEWQLMFNSVAGSLGGFCTTSWTNFTTTPVLTAQASISGGTIGSALKFTDLNFELTFTFSAGTSPNAVQLTEFSIDRV